MSFDERATVLIIRMKGFAIKAGCKDEAADLVQEAFARCLAKIKENDDYQKRAMEESEWFEQYTFKTLINLVINNKKRKRRLDRFIDNDGNEKPDLKHKEKLIDDVIIEEQRQIVLKKFIFELRETLSGNEKTFIDVLLEVAEESDGINISEIGRILTMPADKAHNTWRRIKIKAMDHDAKKRALEDISTASPMGDFSIDGSTVESVELARKCLANLALSDITLLSTIL